ncbi:MAG: branched-chain amino acid ABC transporter ATP-binding protein, partial [Enterocloster bolteae]
GMMSNPKLLMFDEPSLGLAPVIVDEMFRAIIHINEMKKIPIVIAEQNAFMAMGISNRTYVLEVGHVVNHGKSSVLLDSPEIKKAYLGG